MDENRKTALEYAQKYGWRVFPSGEDPTKGTTDPAVIDRMWSEHPGLGIGIVTGPESDLLVLHIYKTDSANGMQTLRTLAQSMGRIPNTARASVAGHEYYLYYRYPKQQKITVGKKVSLGAGVDLYGAGACVVAPPSKHPESGIPCRWEPKNSPDQVKVAPFPRAWVNHLKSMEQGSLISPDAKRDLNADEIQKVLSSMQMFSADKLASEVFDPIIYPVSEIVPTGLTLIAAPPKTGKSWLCLDMAIQIARGERFLTFPTTKSSVIYFTMEDCDIFAQERLLKILDGVQPPENLHLILTGVKTMDDGFFTQAKALLQTYPDTKVMIIDTLGLIAGSAKKGESAYAYDYRTGAALKNFADDHKIAIVAVTHTTKLKHSEDFLMNISGTNGVSGSADCTIVLDKEKRTDKDALLFVCGRRVRQKTHSILFDDNKCKWIYQRYMEEGDRAALEEREAERLYMSSDIRKAVIQVAEHNKSWVGSVTELRIAAAKYGIGITETPKSVGAFLCSEVGRFMNHDKIHVWKIKNGKGSNRYRISAWAAADSELLEELDFVPIDENQSINGDL